MQRHSSVADHPLSVSWEVTRSLEEDAPENAASLELSPSECREVVNQIAEMEPRLLLISGDPLARPDLLDIIRRATANGLWVALRPVLRRELSDFDFDAFREAGVRSLSICLGEARTSGSSRRIAQALSALTAARRSRLPVQLRTPAPESGDLRDFFKLVEMLRPAEWRVSLPLDHPLELAEARRTETLLNALSIVPQTLKVPLGVSHGPQFRRISLQSPPHPQRRRSIQPLNDGRGRLFISHRGDIQPSRALPVVCGNVRQDHALDIYRESLVFRRLRNPDLLRGKCGRCGFRLICGGSRARAFASHGDYLGEDPACPYVSPERRPLRAALHFAR